MNKAKKEVGRINALLMLAEGSRLLGYYDFETIEAVMRRKPMKMVVAAVLLSALVVPAFAADKAKEPATEETAQEAKPADPAKVAKAADLLSAIQKDDAKLKVYCEMQELFNQADEAEEKKKEDDAKKLVASAEEKGKSLGSDFELIMNMEEDIDPESAEGKKFFAELENVEKKCEKK
jgi:hypothetical protein